MNTAKIINIVLFSLVIVTMVSVSVYAQDQAADMDQGRDIDVTMDVIRQSDVRDLTESVMNRIHLPDAARKGQRMADETGDRHRIEHGTGDAQHMMHNDVDSVKEDTMQMRENVHHMRNETNHMGNGGDDVREENPDMRNDENGMGGGMMN